MFIYGANITQIALRAKFPAQILCLNSQKRFNFAEIFRINYAKIEFLDMETGLSHTSRLMVAEENTALALGSGDMLVLATPQMVALMENAAMMAVRDHLPDGATTVGSMINTTHVRPTAVGMEVKATATLTEAEGRKLTFAVKAEDANGVVGEGTHIRYVVDRQKFLSKI